MKVDIFVQFIISRILQGFRRVLDAQKFGVSENYKYNKTSRTNCYVRERFITRICLLEVDARKFSCAKISMFTVSGKIL